MHAFTIFIQSPYRQATPLAEGSPQQSTRFKPADQGLDLGQTTSPVYHSHFAHRFSATLNADHEQGALLRRIRLFGIWSYHCQVKNQTGMAHAELLPKRGNSTRAAKPIRAFAQLQPGSFRGQESGNIEKCKRAPLGIGFKRRQRYSEQKPRVDQPSIANTAFPSRSETYPDLVPGAASKLLP